MATIPERKRILAPNSDRGFRRPWVAYRSHTGSEYSERPLSVGDWLLTLIVLAIPGLNIILYGYWAFFSNGNRGRINFCRASLIFIIVGFALALVAGVF